MVPVSKKKTAKSLSAKLARVFLAISTAALDPSFRNLVCLDASGREAAAVSRQSRQALETYLNRRRQGLFKEIKKEIHYIGPVYIDEESSEPLVTMAVSIKDLFADYKGLLIADNGPGMDEETRKRVFEPFITTKPVGLGTGLGISLSYFIICKNQGCSIAVESQAGCGATFIIRLPCGG